MIIDHGKVNVGLAMVRAADSVKRLNYKVNTPKRFQVERLHDEAAGSLMEQLSSIMQQPKENLDFVYFSCCAGAEPHVDALDPREFTERTIVVPIILPPGRAVLTAQVDKEHKAQSVQVKLNHAYEFNHELTHSLELEDTESGCVVVMVSVKR